MSWKDLIQSGPSQLVAPWLGGRKVYHENRTWRLVGDIPDEYGWYLFSCIGRTVKAVGSADPDPNYSLGYVRVDGYLTGNVLIPPLHTEAFQPSSCVHLVEPGLDRFTYIEAIIDPAKRLIYSQELFPLGPIDEVREAFINRNDSLSHIKNVSPALELAFEHEVERRVKIEKRRAELEAKRKREEALRSMGTSEGRRHSFDTNPEGAARSALAVGGAIFLDMRPGRYSSERIIQFRLERQRFECVIQVPSLQIIDSGICLTDEYTGEKGDTYLTLESLPSVINQAIREHRLVVYRHVE